MEELVFITDPEDRVAVRAAGFDGVLMPGGLERFDAPGRLVPWYDEPEDHPAGFEAWWQAHGQSGLVRHWDPAKAAALGVWKNPPIVSWNWYPVNRWTPAFVQGWYLPYHFWRYRRYLTATLAYGTVQAFSGWDTPPAAAQGDSDPAARGSRSTLASAAAQLPELDYTFPSALMMRTILRQFQDGLGFNFQGYVWFAWSLPGFPDHLSRHPEWWPIHRRR